MDEIEKNTAAEKAPSKRFWTAPKVVGAIILALIVICVCVYCYRDKPAKLIQTTDLDGANPAKGEIVDYRFAYNAKQDEELGPPEENGWRLILQALGPCALQQRNLAETVPWEEFPTNDASKAWFNGQWTWLCEKFKLDPHERPTMLDRMSLWSYVGKYGLTGDEPEPSRDAAPGIYYENGEEHPAKFTDYQTLEFLAEKPWTEKDYPVAARWIEENADLYDVLAKAARSPKFGCWHFVPEPLKGGFIGTLLPDIQNVREFARLLQVRARYRIGSGDLSGAIDDVETMTLFGRAQLEHETGSLVERLMGIACIGMAFGVPLFENADVAPTQEELARVAELRASLFRDGQMENWIQRALDGERVMFGYGTYVDILAVRRSGVSPEVLYDAPPSTFTERAIDWLLFRLPPVNDAKSFQIYKELYNSAIDEENNGALEKEIEAQLSPSRRFRLSPEKTYAYFGASLLIPAMTAAKEAFYRTECVAKIGTITTALCAYRAEHGTLPPAFTVDENGKPLQSWRVLILPYLGDDAKALYEKLRLDEPWDSEYNRAFHDQIPDVFRCPSAKDLKEGETIYSVLLGDDGLFDESGTGKDFIEMTKLPGRDVWNQFLVVERAAPVCWMTPDQELKIADYTADGKTDVAKFFTSRRHAGGLNYSAPSGRTAFVAETSTEFELEAYLRGLPQPKKEEDDDSTDDVEDPVEEPTAEEPSDPEPANDETVGEELTVEEPSDPEPADDETVDEEPTVEEPSDPEPADDETADGEPTVEEPSGVESQQP